VEVTALSLFNICPFLHARAAPHYALCPNKAIERAPVENEFTMQKKASGAFTLADMRDAMVNKYLDGRAMHFILIRSCAAARLLPERRSRMNRAHD
jgi:hypothetical protein